MQSATTARLTVTVLAKRENAESAAVTAEAFSVVYFTEPSPKKGERALISGGT